MHYILLLSKATRVSYLTVIGMDKELASSRFFSFVGERKLCVSRVSC